MDKAPDAYRTISEVADDLDIAQHVLRFWETRFTQIRPLKRGGGRRYYRPDDVELLKGIRHLLYNEGYTIRGVQRILKDQGQRLVQSIAQDKVPEDWLAENDAPPVLAAQKPAPAEPFRSVARSEPVFMPAPEPQMQARQSENRHIGISTHHDAERDPVSGFANGTSRAQTAYAHACPEEPAPDHTPVSPASGQVSMFRGGLQPQTPALSQAAAEPEAPVDETPPEMPVLRPALNRGRRVRVADLQRALTALEECRDLIEATLARRGQAQAGRQG